MTPDNRHVTLLTLLLTYVPWHLEVSEMAAKSAKVDKQVAFTATYSNFLQSGGGDSDSSHFAAC